MSSVAASDKAAASVASKAQAEGNAGETADAKCCFLMNRCPDSDFPNAYERTTRGPRPEDGY